VPDDGNVGTSLGDDKKPVGSIELADEMVASGPPAIFHVGELPIDGKVLGGRVGGKQLENRVGAQILHRLACIQADVVRIVDDFLKAEPFEHIAPEKLAEVLSVAVIGGDGVHIDGRQCLCQLLEAELLLIEEIEFGHGLELVPRILTRMA